MQRLEELYFSVEDLKHNKNNGSRNSSLRVHDPFSAFVYESESSATHNPQCVQQQHEATWQGGGIGANVPMLLRENVPSFLRSNPSDRSDSLLRQHAQGPNDIFFNSTARSQHTPFLNVYETRPSSLHRSQSLRHTPTATSLPGIGSNAESLPDVSDIQSTSHQQHGTNPTLNQYTNNDYNVEFESIRPVIEQAEIRPPLIESTSSRVGHTFPRHTDENRQNSRHNVRQLARRFERFT